MKFFMPELTKANQAANYIDIRKELDSQLRCKISDRKIFSITYTHDKKQYRAEVGKKEELENSFQIVAIYEANVFIICTQDRHHEPRNIILVNKDEVTKVEDFT